MKLNNTISKPIIFLLYFLIGLCINNLYSQTSIIKGSIKDLNTKPVEFATIQLLYDSTFNQATLSDTAGIFYLKTNLKGEAELVINCLGYVPVNKKIIINNDTAINIILLHDAFWINEVTITAQKPLIQAKPDGLIINIEGIISTKGKETTDILKQLPTLNVTEQAVNMSGKSTVIVYINDRMVRLDGQSLLGYLNSLPPDIINSIEIISTPPAQYEAEGNTGIVKIITKKNIQPGWKEYFKTGFIQNNYSSYMIAAYTNFTGKKMFFEGSINNINYCHLNQTEYYSYFPNATITTFNPKKWGSVGIDAQTTFGYKINKNSNIIIDLQAPLFNEETVRDIKNKTSFVNPITENTDSIIISNGKTIKKNYTYNLEVFFKHLFPNKKSYFTANTAYLNNSTLNKRTFASSTQLGNTNQTTENYYTEGDLNYDILTSKIDFSFPLFNFSTAAGYKFSFVNNASNSKFFTVVNEKNILNTSLSNKFEYTEHIHAFYYSMGKNIANWSFKAGVRSEITQTTGKSMNNNELHKNDYIDFFPSFYVSNKLNNNNDLMLSYSRRIERPPYQFLDPFKWYITKYDYALGNPFLLPAYIHNIELTYIFNNTFSTKLYYTSQNNKIGQYVVLDSLNIMNQMQKADNFLNENNYGINIYKSFKLSHWLSTVLQNDFYYSEYYSNKKAFENVFGFGNIITIYNTISLNKNFQGILNIEEHLPGLYDYRNMKNYFKLDIGCNYRLAKKGIDARFILSDIFKTANPEYNYTSGGVKQIYRNYMDTRLLKLMITWRIGNWYNKTSEIPSSSNMDEKQRL